MIIDCHAHMSAPDALWAYKAKLVSHRGAHGRGKVEASDDEIRAAFMKPEMAPKGHIPIMDAYGTDVQLLSPRPYQLMHSEKPGKLVHWFVEECNSLIARECALYPDRFIGVAGLPQVAGAPVVDVLPELERCVKQLGFVGCLLNPDPYENSGTEAPPLGDRYWYPLYEKLCELDVPAHIHSTGSRSERTSYSLHFINEESIAVAGLVNSTVLDDFPQLKILVSHGGGAIPYQVGRFQSASTRRKGPTFIDRLRRLYFDTVLYSADALALLIRTVGADRCLFGAELPGVGSGVDPRTGRTFDDIAPVIRGFDWLSQDDKERILWRNAVEIFGLQARLPQLRAAAE
jgi:predicted TIM-barrel fold metal-dependent hydrolase